MSLDFSGDLSGFQKKDLPSDIKKFVKNVRENPKLQENNIDVYSKDEVEGLTQKFNTLRGISLILMIIILVIGAVFAYLVWDGKFQSNINQNLSCPPVNISCPDIPSQPACPNPAPIYINATCNPILRCPGGNNSI